MVKCKTCGKYSAGMLNSQIEIQSKTANPDGMGGFGEPTWTTIASPFAMIKYLSGRELYAAQRMNPLISAIAVIRFKGDAYNAPLYSAKHRVLYKNRKYAISAVIDPDNSEQWLELSLVEGGAS